MKRTWKRITAMGMACLMAASLAGCGKPGSQSAATDGSTGAAMQESSAETAGTSAAGSTDGKGIKLRVLNWGSTEEERIANEAIERFKASNPGVEVEQTCVPVENWSDFIQKWIMMMTSGQAPDVVNLGLEGVKMAISNDLLMPLDDIVAGDEYLKDLKEKEYTTSLIDGFSQDGKLYGLPSGTQTMVMYYNKDIFDAKGVEYPKDGWTWDDFKEKAQKLTEGKVYGYGLASAYFQLTPWWATNSAYPVTEDYKAPAINSPAMKESVTFLKSLVDEKLTPDPISSDVYTMFSSGELAMVGAGRWVLNAWQDAGVKNFDCVQWPVKTEASSVYGGSAWAIGSATKNQELAIGLLREMVSEETLKEVAAGGQQIPPTEGLATDAAVMGTVPDNIGGLWTAITIAKPVAAPVFYGDMEKGMSRAMENVFSGAQSVDDALNTAQAELEKAAAR